MASLYEQLMASKGAPKAAAASNSTQLRKAPVSLRSAMRKYAEGGDVEGNNAGVDFARAAQSGAPFGGLMQAIMAAAQQAQQTTTPSSDPIPYSPGEGGRGIPTPYLPPEDPGFYQPPVDSFPEPRYPEYARDVEKRKSEQEQENPRVSEDYYFKMRNLLNPSPEEPRYDPTPNPQYPEDPGFYQPPVSIDPMPVPPLEVYPQYPTDPGFYQPPVYDSPTRPIDYYNPSPPMDFPEDPGILQPTEPVYNPASKRGNDLAKLIAKTLASGGGSLEEQRKLMALLEMLKGE